jgi:F420-non-reducing hydrogenase iron-sulfur subunit
MEMNGRIAALLCENSAWKAYLDASRGEAADSAMLAGVDPVRIPCTGVVEPGLVLRMLEQGCAGVLIMGCPKDNCSCIRGNYRAEKRVSATKAALRDAGMDENLIRLEFVSSVDGHRLLSMVKSFKGYIDDHSGT